MERPRIVQRYNKAVFEISEIEKLRKDNCMCLHCGHMNPGTPEHCTIANSFFLICKQHGNAFIMTRCDEWIKKE